MTSRSFLRFVVVLFACLWLVEPPAAHAYIGPGAGIAFASSLFVLLGAFFLAFFKIITFPFRWTWRTIRMRKALGRSRVKRVIILGLDGQDAELTERYMAQGMLPNFSKLREQGHYVPLQSSFPSESPVAWSSFQTGSNPGRHKVFDFLVPNRKSYLPELCSAKVTGSPRTLKLGRYRLPIGKPAIDLGRKSQPFWKTLGDHGIFSTILRVPITFPPEKFKGAMLAAMCVPDLKGSQGTFSYYSSDPGEQNRFTGGIQIPVEVRDGVVSTYISGPDNSMVKDGQELRLPFDVRLNGSGDGATLVIDKKSYPLEPRKFTEWIPIQFRPAPSFKVRGICRFYLKETAPHFKLYMSPVNIDPDKPALPISHPFTYAIYLSKTLGRYTTLGLAEDTWGLNERVLDEQAFLDQAYLIHEEREKQFFDALEKTKRGLVCCVFDITDRLQHMFWRYLDPDHPANRDKDATEHRDAIPQLYRDMDDLLGRTMQHVGKKTVLMVMSDHGFKPFKRGVNLNTWLWQNGYLVLKEGKPSGSEWYQDVDWERTRAYAVGLGGIYLNVKDRMARGIVEQGEEERKLRKEIGAKLKGLRDEAQDAAAVAEVYDTREIYEGPYVREAPDLFVGFHVGWRASWNCAVGKIDEEIFDDNTKSWSGDHCMNPPDVPGIFFCNEKLAVKDRIHIQDIGPTVLDLFGVPVPPYCDGKPVIPAEES
jgi:predicted AlkP superfamily phosphohydrolase/phosphomutase